MPIFTFKSIDDVPIIVIENANSYGLKQSEDGTYTLNLAPMAKIEEFREANIRIMKSLEEISGSYERLIEELDKGRYHVVIETEYTNIFRIAEWLVENNLEKESEFFGLPLLRGASPNKTFRKVVFMFDNKADAALFKTVWC